MNFFTLDKWVIMILTREKEVGYKRILAEKGCTAGMDVGRFGHAAE
jgi:hypothetical protein